jgi:ribosomal protein L27
MTWFKTNTIRWFLTVIGFTSGLVVLISSTQAQQTGPRQVPGTNISIGKDNYLFGNLQIFSGFNTSTQERLNRNLETVVQIKQALLRRNIQLAVVYVPFVGRIYPERLPNDFKIPTRMQGAYAASLKKWRENGSERGIHEGQRSSRN